MNEFVPPEKVARALLGVPSVYNKAKRDAPVGSVYVGRPTIWGNMFHIGRDGSREEVCRRYREWLMKQPTLVARARKELRGKNLVCWCAPLGCHADILLEIANAEAEGESL
jgi:hypothetical protein